MSTLSRALAVLITAAPATLASTHQSAFDRFLGLWIGTTEVIEGQRWASQDADVAIWQSRSGVGITWRNLVRDKPGRVTLRLVGVDTDRFEVEEAAPPTRHGENYQVRFEGNSLIVLRQSTIHGMNQSSRYEYTVSDGYMTVRQVHVGNGTASVSEELKLRRTKVIM